MSQGGGQKRQDFLRDSTHGGIIRRKLIYNQIFKLVHSPRQPEIRIRFEGRGGKKSKIFLRDSTHGGIIRRKLIYNQIFKLVHSPRQPEIRIRFEGRGGKKNEDSFARFRRAGGGKKSKVLLRDSTHVEEFLQLFCKV